ncbi:M14 family zinc carboxypeptidase [Streptomyces sp. NPDC055006]
MAARPRLLRLSSVGVSRRGSPLWLLSAGHGPRDVLVVAGAHANEPAGGASALALAGHFALDPEVLARTGCTWHLLLCLDPDGMRLAERWLHGPRSVEGYFRNFYRPAFTSQPEFLPVTGEGRDPMPESQALVWLIDELRPAVQFSLHGVEVGGSFLQLTRQVPGAAEVFRGVAARQRIPLELRPFDGMGWYVDAPGVLVLPGAQAADERDPTGFTSEATWTYAMRHGTVSAVVETPYWAVPAVSDARPTAGTRERELARLGELLLSRTKQLEAVLGECTSRVPEERLPFLTAAKELIEVAPGIVDTWTSYDARELGAAELAATVGNSVSLGISARRTPLRAAAMLRGALGERPAPADAAVAARLDGLVGDWCQDMERQYEPRWVPLTAQTNLHTQTMLGVARAAV